MTEISDLKHEDERLDWDDYFMQLAELVKERSTCFRRKVGAVAVDENTVSLVQVTMEHLPV